MDSISVNVNVTESVYIAVDNGTLNPTTFRQQKSSEAGYGTVGSTTTTIDRLYYNSLTLGKSETVGIDLTSLPTEPGGVGSGGAVVTLTGLSVIIVANGDSTITGSGLRIGDSAGTNMAKMMFGSVSTTFDLPKDPGIFVWGGDVGVPRGGNSIKFTNLDSSNSITFTVKITGRSA